MSMPRPVGCGDAAAAAPAAAPVSRAGAVRQPLPQGLVSARAKLARLHAQPCRASPGAAPAPLPQRTLLLAARLPTCCYWFGQQLESRTTPSSPLLPRNVIPPTFIDSQTRPPHTPTFIDCPA